MMTEAINAMRFTTMKFTQAMLFFFAMHMLLPFSAIGTNGERTFSFHDNESHLSISFPEGWTGKPGKPGSALRLHAQNRALRASADVFSFPTKGSVDLEKLEGLEKKVSRNLGIQTSEKKIRNRFFLIRGTEARYENGQVRTLVRRMVDGTYGYLAIIRGPGQDYSYASSIADTLETNVPYKENFLNKAKGFFSANRIMYIFGGLVLAGVLFLLGKAGQMVSTGRRLHKHLAEAAQEGAKKGMVPNAEWHRLKRRAVLMTVVPPVGFALAYITAFFLLTSWQFFISLVVLVVRRNPFFS